MLKLSLSLCLFAVGSFGADFYSVKGRDARGSYSGYAAVNGAAVARAIDYDDAVNVEGDRKLSWVVEGTVEGGKFTAPLRVADFVARRGALVRTTADLTPRRLVADMTQATNGGVDVRGEGWSETWARGTAAAASERHLGSERREIPTHSPFSAVEKNVLFFAFQSFHHLPNVAPYAASPAFQTAQHSAIVDTTDLAYYRAHPDRLRIRGKVIDAVSLGEELSRANAFRFTLHEKAKLADRLNAEKFFDSDAKQLSFGLVGDRRLAAGDGALWLGLYLASQSFRHEVTGEPEALRMTREALEGILRLQEITGDERVFARTIRRKGAGEAGWNPGVAPYQDYEWLPKGNNDMSKGLMVGLVFGWKTFCTPRADDAVCARIQRNARAFADKVKHGAVSENRVLAPWIAAYVNAGPQYLKKARGAWPFIRPILEHIGSINTYRGQGDWSGLNLNFVSTLVLRELAGSLPLDGFVGPAVMKRIADFVKSTSKMRIAVWDFADAAWLHRATAARADGILRLTELPVPKPGLNVDHSIAADFVISPIPEVPWKADWKRNDRRQSLRGYPLYEAALGEYAWKDGAYDWRGSTEGIDASLADYSFLYWFARVNNVLGTEE